ncbi:MAG: GntR family transcriptional regulator [Faecalibacterium sp.]
MAALSAREAAYQKIYDRIITMQLKPGDPLNDRELAEEMGISRTPVREALIMLNLAHMVTIKPQSGTHVAPIDLKLMEMEQFARFTLEKEILLHLRGRLTDEQIAGYMDLLERYDRMKAGPVSRERNERMLELDNKFHRRAFELCGMAEHFDHMLGAFQHIERLRMFSLMSGENMSVVQEHTCILDALRHGGPDDVDKALHAHLDRYKLSVEDARRKSPEYFIDG